MEAKFPEARGEIDNLPQGQSEQKKTLPLYLETFYNILLGFANWDAFETFKKEGKFVKKIFTQFHYRDIEPLIYQNLTRQEK